MSTRASKWPNPCDYRPAWWGVGASYLHLPMPRKLLGGMDFYSPSDSRFPRPTWFPSFNPNPYTTMAWEAYPEGCSENVMEYLPLGSPSAAWTVKFKDEWFDHPTAGLGWNRFTWGRIDNYSSGEWIVGATDLAHDYQEDGIYAWVPGPYDCWDILAGPVLGYALKPVDWNVSVWPNPPPPPRNAFPGFLVVRMPFGKLGEWTFP